MTEIAVALSCKIVPSPVGALKLVARDEGLAAVLWDNDGPSRVRLGELHDDPEHPLLMDAERQLGEYFAGRRTSFSVRLDMAGTDFQVKVWRALLTIPFGETRSYGELARQVGNPNASRAVGAANGRNPLSIVAPCHRAIGSDGSLTGFAGGLAAKRYLLSLEAQRTTPGALFAAGIGASETISASAGQSEAGASELEAVAAARTG